MFVCMCVCVGVCDLISAVFTVSIQKRKPVKCEQCTVYLPFCGQSDFI